MKCLRCGRWMKTSREDYGYSESGLPNVTLLDVEVSRCPGCGEREVAIPRIGELHRVIAQSVARQVCRLSPAEIRFLREYLQWSAAEFAKHMGVTAETVSRWENGAAAMGGVAERLLRLMALTRPPARDDSLDLMKEVAKKKAVPHRLKLRATRTGWSLVAA